jgi:hypothetical protein
VHVCPAILTLPEVGALVFLGLILFGAKKFAELRGLPHGHAEFRPHLVRSAVLAMVCAIAITLLCGAAGLMFKWN